MLRCGAIACMLFAGAASAQVFQQGVTDFTYRVGSTPTQGVRPLYMQRGVGLDGTTRAGSSFGWSLAANAAGEPWDRHISMGSVRLDTGSYASFDVDLTLPAKTRWTVARTYNANQKDASNAHQDSNGYQGRNWFQNSQPEILFNDADSNAGTKGADDRVYMVYGADRYVEFKRTATDADTFRGVHGATGLITWTSGSPDTWTFYDTGGTRTYFFGFNTSGNATNGQIWKIVDPEGSTAYVGNSSNASTAITDGYSGGRITSAFDSSDRRYTYTYTTIDSVPRLTQVKAETKTGGTWSSPTGVAEVGRVDYAYYTGSDSNGDNGCLKAVTITTPLSPSGVSSTRVKYYRYYVGSYNGSTNPGNPYQLKLVLGFEGSRRFDWSDSTFDEDYLTETTANLKSYADAYLEYTSASDYRLSKAFFSGQCGCSGGSGSGTYEFTYTDQTCSDLLNYSSAWCSRAIIKQPDTTYTTQYFDVVGQPLDRVVTNTDPGGGTAPTQVWAQAVDRDSNGVITSISSPENVTAYTHSSGTLTKSASAGTIGVTSLYASGDLQGLPSAAKTKDTGTGANATYLRETTGSARQLSVSGTSVYHAQLDASRAFHTAGTTSTSTNYDETTYSYTYWSSTSSDVLYITPKKITTTLPAVAAAKNGENSTHTTERYLNQDGTTAFTKSEDGTYTYSEYSTHGQLTKFIRDPKSGSSESAMDTAAGSGVFNISLPSAGSHLVTTHTYDAQGRGDETAAPDGRVSKVYYTKLADGRLVTIGIPRVSSGTFYGPASYTVSNLAGQAEFSATIRIADSGTTTALSSWVSTSASDPITALSSSAGTLTRVSTQIFSNTGTQRDESRAYFLVPSSGAGTDGTNYDATKYGYDALGRLRRVEQPSGTITRTVFDTLGRVSERWTGTNDVSFAGGSTSGTDNMVKIEAIEYDGGSAGKNSLVTKRTLYVQGSTTNQRETSYAYDARGRLLLTTNPVAPHTLNKYDNLGRGVASAQYSTAPSSSSDPTGYATGRVALSESTYDERGRVYRTTRWEVDQSDGSKDTSLSSDRWYDAAGRVVKTKGEGTITKTQYDRLGRAAKTFTIGDDGGETSYSDMLTVSGDKVLEEAITHYGNTDTSLSGKVTMSAVIQRWHNDTTTTGDLDSNADNDVNTLTEGNVSGRVSISVSWSDELGRTVDTVSYGTNGFTGSGSATFALKPSGSWLTVPARSDTALRTTSTYNTDGTLQKVTDPRGVVTRYEYDAAGRRTVEIRNYLGGSLTSADRVNDLYTRYDFADGLMTRMWVDIDGDGSVDAADDQVTEYTYGTTKGTAGPDSLVASGHLLKQVKYPDSSSSTDVVAYAYNAQGQRIWQKDQLGCVIETDYDALGRETHRRVTDMGTGSGLDASVRRASTAYLSRGMVDTVTQYDHAAVGSGTATDQVQFAYDGWGNLTTFTQDPDSVVGASGRAAFAVTHAYTKATPVGGADALRRTSTGYGGATVSYTYSSGQDDRSSRVSSLSMSSVALAGYEYLGVGSVVSTTLNEPGAFTAAFVDSATASVERQYAHLDRFGRVTRSAWIAPGGAAFHDITLTHDRGSNIISSDDAVAYGLDAGAWADAAYSVDDLGRLTSTREGELVSGSISTGGRTREELWTTLSPTGNWKRRKLDLNGDGDYSDTGELDDTGTFNLANEWLTRDTDSNSSVNHTLTHDAAGNMTDDGTTYKLVYDAFGRVKEVKNRSSNALVMQYAYNALGHRISFKYDTDSDSDVDGSDLTYYLTYDERWRHIATYRGSDSNPKERLVYHCAGLGGHGGSSYIDLVVLRDRDANTAWTSASDGTLEERRYFCQNWRADTVAVLGPGTDTEFYVHDRVKYDAYGKPRFHQLADYNHDGGVTSDDYTDFLTAFENGDPEADCNFDTGITIDDLVLFLDDYENGSLSNVRNLYAGYIYDDVLSGSGRSFYHVRYRVLDADIGRWTRRDPLIESPDDNIDMYEAMSSAPIATVDPSGLLDLEVAFAAFIGGFRGNYLPEPFNPLTPRADYWFKTDQRGFGQFNFSSLNPNARLSSVAIVDSTKIGRATLGNGVKAWSKAGVSQRWSGDPSAGGRLVGQKTATVTDPLPKVSNPDKCTTLVEFSPSAHYPFVSYSPDIDYSVAFRFSLKCPGVIVELYQFWMPWNGSDTSGMGQPGTLSGSYFHNAFPDYEAYLPPNRQLVYTYTSPDVGPGLGNLVFGIVETPWIARYIDMRWEDGNGDPDCCCGL